MTRSELDYVKKHYPILRLLREFQEELGMPSWGTVSEDDGDRKCLCPIHNEADPSMKVYVGTNSCYCFVCARAWDPPGLYAVYHGVSVGQAVRVLLGRLGVAPASVKPSEGRSTLLEMLDMLDGKPRPPVSRGVAQEVARSIWEWACDITPEWPEADGVRDEMECAFGCDAALTLEFVRGALDWFDRATHGRGPRPPIESREMRYLLGI